MRVSVTFFALSLAIFGFVAEAGTVEWKNYKVVSDATGVLDVVQNEDPDFSITCADDVLTNAVKDAQDKVNYYVGKVKTKTLKEKVLSIQVKATVDDNGGIKLTLYRYFPDRWTSQGSKEVLTYIQPGSKCVVSKNMTID